MRRMLLTIAGTKCPFGCTYCFADFREYQAPVTLETVEQNPTLLCDVDIVYPACDVDLFALPDPVGLLWRTARLGKSISVSTKAKLSRKMVGEVSAVAASLRDAACVLKVGVSFSTKYRVPQLEPHAVSYDVRLDNLRFLQAAGVPTCAVLKPIMASLPVAEYLEIVRDTSAHTSLFLLGDRYLDSATQSPDLTSLPGAELTNRRVHWAPGQPTWPVQVAADHVAAIKRGIVKIKKHYFDSDLQLMQALMGTRGGAQACARKRAVADVGTAAKCHLPT